MVNIEDYRIKIVTGQYKQAPLDQRKMMHELFGENAEYKYELYFHWYNVIHELGHAIMMFNSPARPHPAEEEQMVNNFAYAFWRHYGESEKLNELSSLVDETVQKFHNPAQNNESYMEYAKDKWGKEELSTFNNYGWFQFSSVRAAITGATNLEQELGKMCSVKVSPKKADTMKYEICDQMPEQVVADAVRLMKVSGVLLPEDIKIIFCDDVNCHMCQVENLRDGRIY